MARWSTGPNPFYHDDGYKALTKKNEYKVGLVRAVKRNYDPKTGRSYTSSGFIRERPRSMKFGETHEFTTTTGRKIKVPVDDFNDFVAYNRQVDGSGELQTLQANSEIGNYVETGLQSKSLWSIGEFDSGSPRHVMCEARGHISALRYNARRQLLVVDFNGYANNTSGTTVCFFRIPTGVAGELYSLFRSGAKRSDGRHMVGVRFWDLVRIRGTLHGSHYRYEYTDGGFSKSIGLRYQSPFNKFYYLNEDITEKHLDEIVKQSGDPVLSDAYLKTLALPDAERREAKAKTLFKFRYRLDEDSSLFVSYDPAREFKSADRQTLINMAQDFENFKATKVKEYIEAKKEGARYSTGFLQGKIAVENLGDNGTKTTFELTGETHMNEAVLEMSDAEIERVVLSDIAISQVPVGNSQKSFLRQLMDGDETVPYIVRGVINETFRADPKHPGRLEKYFDSMEGRLIGLWQEYNKIKTNGIQAASKAEGIRKREEAERNYFIALRHFLLEAALHGVAKASRPRATQDRLDLSKRADYSLNRVNQMLERSKSVSKKIESQRKVLYNEAKRTFFKDKYDKKYSELVQELKEQWEGFSDDRQLAFNKKGLAWVDKHGEITEYGLDKIKTRLDKYINKLYKDASSDDLKMISKIAESDLTKYIDSLEKTNQAKGFSSQSALKDDVFSERPEIIANADQSLKQRMVKLGISDDDIKMYFDGLTSDSNNEDMVSALKFGARPKYMPITFGLGNRKPLDTKTDDSWTNTANAIANRASYTNTNPYYKYHGPTDLERRQLKAELHGEKDSDVLFEKVPIAWDKNGKPTKYGYSSYDSPEPMEDSPAFNKRVSDGFNQLMNRVMEDDTFFDFGAWDEEERKLNKR